MENVPKFRFVRCPKCSKILMEIDDVPIYQCGACGVPLHAKVHAAAAGTSSSPSRESKKVDQSPADNTTSNESEKQIDPSLHQNSLEEHDKKIEIGDLVKDLIGDSSKVIEPQARKRDEILEASQVQADGNVYSISEDHAAEEVEENLKFSGAETEMDKSEADNDSITYDILRSTRIPKTTEGGSVSSLDDVRSTPSHKTHHLLSRRTFRSPNVPNSSGNKAEECRHVSTGISSIHGKKLTLKLRESHLSSSSKSFYSNGGKFFQESSFISTGFHSDRNWMDSLEKFSGFTSRNSAYEEDVLRSSEIKYLGHHGIELLKKVQELMDQVRELPIQSSRRGSQYIKRHPARGSHFWSGESVHSRDQFLRTQPSQFQDSCVQCFSHNQSTCNELYRAYPYRTCYGNQNAGCSYVRTASCSSPCYDQASTLHQDLEKTNSKTKTSVPKRRYLPVAGGAPFIICFKCFKVLMLPADFLPSSRSLQKLRCGACSEANVYQSSLKEKVDSLSKPNVEDDTDPRTEQTDPISFSDDYGISSSNSYSADPDSVLQVPYNSSAASEKSEIALHQLFGYASARDILFQPTDEEGYESIWKDLVRSCRPSGGNYAGYESDKREKTSTKSWHSSGGSSSNT